MKQLYTFDLYLKDMDTISEMIEKIKRTENPHLVSIYRGSLGMGAFLSNKLDLPLSIVKYQTYDSNDKEINFIHNQNIGAESTIIILDDIGDTYGTLKKAYEFFYKHFPNSKIKSYTLFGKKLLNNTVPNNTYINEHEGNWLVFEHNGEVL